MGFVVLAPMTVNDWISDDDRPSGTPNLLSQQGHVNRGKKPNRFHSTTMYLWMTIHKFACPVREYLQ